MAQVSLVDVQVKELFKLGILEFFQEPRDLLSALFVYVIEGLSFVNAIRSPKAVSLAEVFQILEVLKHSEQPSHNNPSVWGVSQHMRRLFWTSQAGWAKRHPMHSLRFGERFLFFQLTHFQKIMNTLYNE